MDLSLYFVDAFYNNFDRWYIDDVKQVTTIGLTKASENILPKHLSHFRNRQMILIFSMSGHRIMTGILSHVVIIISQW